MIPWYIATQPFTPDDGDRWINYVKWSGLTQLQEVVSLDGMLCPTLLPEIEDEYWPHIVQESFMLNYFLDFDYLLSQVDAIEKKNVLCVFRNPVEPPQAPPVGAFPLSWLRPGGRSRHGQRAYQLWWLPQRIREFRAFERRPSP